MQCPFCGSTQVQPHAVAHADGTSASGSIAPAPSAGNSHKSPATAPRPRRWPSIARHSTAVADAVRDRLQYRRCLDLHGDDGLPCWPVNAFMSGMSALRHNWKQAASAWASSRRVGC